MGNIYLRRRDFTYLLIDTMETISLSSRICNFLNVQ